MTPNDLLNEVKKRFSPLIVVDPIKLSSYLDRALRMYRDRAGVIRNLDIKEDKIERPNDALELVGVSDTNGNYVECVESRELDDVSNEHKVMWTLKVESNCKGRFEPPYRVVYLLDLAGLDKQADQLPRGIISLLGDYLEALIDIENTQRLRMAGSTAEIPVDSLRTDAELIDRKNQLELDMQEMAEILPMMVVI